MIVSLEAIFLSTFVMISQNRQDDAVRPAGRLGGAGHGRRRTTRQTGRHGTVGAPHPIRQAHPRDGGSATQPPGATLRQSRLRDDPLHLQHLADLLAACLEVAPPLTLKHLTILKEALRARDRRTRWGSGSRPAKYREPGPGSKTRWDRVESGRQGGTPFPLLPTDPTPPLARPSDRPTDCGVAAVSSDRPRGGRGPCRQPTRDRPNRLRAVSAARPQWSRDRQAPRRGLRSTKTAGSPAACRVGASVPAPFLDRGPVEARVRRSWAAEISLRSLGGFLGRGFPRLGLDPHPPASHSVAGSLLRAPSPSPRTSRCPGRGGSSSHHP